MDAATPKNVSQSRIPAFFDVLQHDTRIPYAVPWGIEGTEASPEFLEGVCISYLKAGNKCHDIPSNCIHRGLNTKAHHLPDRWAVCAAITLSIHPDAPKGVSQGHSMTGGTGDCPL